MGDITATISQTVISATVTNVADVTATASTAPISATLSSGDVNATVSETEVAATLLNGGTITATVTSSPITAVVSDGITEAQGDARYFQITNNLSEGTAATMRSNLGLGTLAVFDDAPSDGSTYGRKDGAWAVAAGVTDHSALSNLGYASAGHTGFAGTGAANVFTALNTFGAGGDFRSDALDTTAFTARSFSSITNFTQSVGSGPSPTTGNDFNFTSASSLNGSITITTGGARGVAEFSWTVPGGGGSETGVVTAAENIVGNYGLTINWPDDTFVLNDAWTFTANSPTVNTYEVLSRDGKELVVVDENGVTFGNDNMSTYGELNLNVSGGGAAINFQQSGSTGWTFAENYISTTKSVYYIRSLQVQTRHPLVISPTLSRVVINSSSANESGILGQLSIHGSRADIKGIVYRGFSSQSADMAQYQKSDGTVYGGFDKVGVFFTAETTTPSAVDSFGKIYFKSDNKMYCQTGDGVEHEIAFA